MLWRAMIVALVLVVALISYKAAMLISRPRGGDYLRGQWNYTDQVRRQALASRTGQQTVVMFGDSQIADSGAERLGFANYGIGGETAEGLASRIPAYDLSRARTVVIEVGINDWMHGGFGGFAPAYIDILNEVPRGARIIAVAIFPFGAKAARYFPLRGAADAVRSANADIALACSRRANCRFLDLAAALGGPDGLKPQYDGGDGLHLSAAGYALFLDRVKEITIR